MGQMDTRGKHNCNATDKMTVTLHYGNAPLHWLIVFYRCQAPRSFVRQGKYTKYYRTMILLYVQIYFGKTTHLPAAKTVALPWMGHINKKHDHTFARKTQAR